MSIEPADLAYDASGTPYSTRYGDVYHSSDSGPGQARHVFIDGNDLPRRWAGARVFTIVETGFGIGLNFLSTWRAWLDDPQRCEHLHFVSVEKHPPARDALARVHASYAELEPLARELRDAWPLLVPGLHRLHFERGRVTLTLAFGDASEIVPKLAARADAIYLDGFAPLRNPEMWSAQLMKALGRLSQPGTTLATYSTAAAVREHLEAAGFAIEKRPGFARKREMLAGRYAPRWPAARKALTAPARHAIVIGAGLAGAAVCERLSARGWRVDLLEARPPASDPAQLRFAGAFHPHISADDALRSRASRGGFLYSLARWDTLESGLEWGRCGLIHVGSDRDQDRRFAEASAALAYPAEYARYVTLDEAEALAGCRLRSGGWWLPLGGWMRVQSLVDAQLAACGDGVTARYGVAVESIRAADDGWRALAEDGSVLASAPVMVLANSSDAQRLASFGDALARVRGQITYVPSDRTVAPHTVVTGRGYVLPASGGIVVAGSTYDGSASDPRPRASGHATNLAHLTRLLPDAPHDLDPATLEGAVGFRCAAPDRMPVIGALPDMDAARAMKAEAGSLRLGDIPRLPGLYSVTGFASRGLTWASLAAETLASRLEGEPLPVESDIADALDPARFVLRRLRRGRL
ncbi:MAG TPA: bifunctional tRNA (5-methylaminomethyl-2-thiouridine)(34)-methyltransferase MnmD/FAD-dependent 5-carboxymethylaminomethyl-2-thiouridine(34) oxidoreductase MnmC [Burkholderiales bacterium]|nr:bifunctional tRNA (5-methylaminomethyl-2-thiouridine)(34)-methyltransferase MnmD/FAD-dependent 5-carboxymethylaminomethyl-2-thiouridine(34) oxidoreductase MnmC [Burkholderiales bacterium]